MSVITQRIDDLQRGGLKIVQSPELFSFGIDAVLLSGFASAKAGECVLDLGTGCGIIPILLSAKTQAEHITGLEIQKQCVELAQKSITLNKLENRVTVIQGDLKHINKFFKPGGFHVVTCNPPYMEPGGGRVNMNSPFAISRHEILCTLEDVISAAAYSLRVGGRFYIVHKPRRLVDILCTMRQKGLEPKIMRFVHAKAQSPPGLVLVMAVKSGQPMLTMLAPLVIYGNDGRYTQETFDMYYN